LDGAATTPIDPRVLDTMLPWMTSLYGNAHSRTHMYGWESDSAVEDARAQVASLIGASPKEIIFTSGATESNNIAVKGVGRFYKARKNHVITTQTEHKCVLDSCRALEQEGFDVTYLPVQNNGLIDMAELEAAMRPETSLVSVMALNNEIGVVQPLAAIGELCRSKKVRGAGHKGLASVCWLTVQNVRQASSLFLETSFEQKFFIYFLTRCEDFSSCDAFNVF